MATKLDDGKLHARVRYAYLALYIVGGLTVLLGLIAELGRIDALLQVLGSGWLVAVEGLVMMTLGYFTMRGSLIALGIAIALYAVDAIASLLLGAIGGLWIRLLVLALLIRGFLALRELRRRATGGAMATAAPPDATAG